MSAPGSPPETGTDFAAPDEEGRQAYRGMSDLPNMAMQVPPQMPVVTSDERFMPGTAPNTVGQQTIPDEIAPVPDMGISKLPIPQQFDQLQAQPKRQHSLLDPTSVADQQYPLVPAKGKQIYKAQFSPETDAEQSYKLSGGLPAVRANDVNPNSKLGAAVDRITGMRGMHERINQKDIQQYLVKGGAGMDPAKIAWCAAFVNATLQQAGQRGSGSAVATSFMNWGKPVQTEPIKGDVMVLSKGKAPGQIGGHVGMSTGRVRQGPNGYEFEMISGNTGRGADRVDLSWEPAQSVTVRRGTEVNPSLSQTAEWGRPRFPGQPSTFGKKNFLEGPLASVDPHNIVLNQPDAVPPIEVGEAPIGDAPVELAELAALVPTEPKNWTDAFNPMSPALARGPMSQAIKEVEEPEINYSPIGFVPNTAKPITEESLYTEPMPLSPEISDNAKAMGVIDWHTRPLRRAGQGALGLLNKLPWQIGEGIFGLAAAPGMALKGENDAPPIAYDVHKWFGSKVQEADALNKKLMGFSQDQPMRPGEQVGELLGESISPAGKATQALTAAIFATKAAFDPRSPFEWNMVTDAMAAPKKDKVTSTAVFEPAVPGHLAAGNLQVGTLFQPIQATPVPLEDGRFKLVPNNSHYGNVTLNADMAIKQYQRTGLNFGTFESAEAAQDFLDLHNAQVVQIGKGATGPEPFKASDLVAMGAPLAMLAGVAFGPSLIRKFTTGNINRPVQGRTVEHAAPGTVAYSRLRDLNKSYFDINAVPGSVAKSAGANPAVVNEINNTWAMGARGGASNYATSAVQTGRADTPTFSFKVKTPLQAIEQTVDPPLMQYMAARGSLEEIKVMERQAQNAAGKTPIAQGSVTLRQDAQGNPLTRQDYEQMVKNYETAHPEVKQKAQMIIQNKQELLRVEKDGEYATKTVDEANRIMREEPHVINYGELPRETTSPAVALADDMHARLRTRIENETIGHTIDTLRTHVPGMFQQITAKQYRENKAWHESTITFKRRGETEYYTTDPLLARAMHLDPYYVKGMAAQLLNVPRRGFEAATTGMLAPGFAWVNFARSHGIIKATAPTMGWKAPNIGQSLKAIPEQLGPQLKNYLGHAMDKQTGGWLRNVPEVAKFLSKEMDRASGGMIRQIFGPNTDKWLDGLSRRMINQFHQSKYAQMQRAGGHYGVLFDQQLRYDNILNKHIHVSKGPFKTFLNGWKATFGSIHGAPAHAAGKLNMGPKQSRQEWALKTRRITGDPHAGGEFMPGGKLLPFHQSPVDKLDRIVGKTGLAASRALGLTTELGRTFVPWFNISIQGMRRIGQAYMDNPKKFAMAMFTSQMAPAAVAYSWNRSLGKDPQGNSYVDYMMNNRSPYNTMMNFYLAIPGRPAHAGIELPGKFHETVIFSRMMEIALDHAFKSNRFGMQEDFAHAALNALKLPLSPAAHPYLNAFLATRGQVGPQGLFEGDIYRRKNYAFDQNVGLPVNIDLFTRAFGGALADVLGGGLAAAVQAEGWDKPGAFTKEAWQRQVERTPVLRNILDTTPKQTGNTRIVQQMYDRQGALKMLEEYYRNWGTAGGNIKLTNKPVSDFGAAKAERLLGRPTPLQQPGLKQPEPSNPMYKAVMTEVFNRITKDDEKKGGVGMKSLMQRYSKTTKELRQMQHVTHGNHTQWQEHLNSNPEVVEFLEQNNVDSTNRREVQSFYEQIRQNAAKEILLELRKIETDIGAKLGKENFKIEDLHPYAKPKSIAEWIHVNDVLDHLNGMWYSATQEVPKGGW